MSEPEDSSALLPSREVLYCGACGMPPEYCEYGPDFETHCLAWLQKHHPEVHATLHGAERTATKPPRPDEPWTIEQRLTAFYEKYVPEKIDSVPGLLEKYEGKEDNLIQALVKKYGPEPEDPYDAESDDEDDGGDEKQVSGKNKRRGASAKKATDAEAIRVVIQKVSQKKKRNLTVITGMDTLPNIKLKDISKTFSKKFAGSSSVKDKTIILQGDHVYDVAELVVDKFNVPEDCVFLDLDGDIVPLKV
jgi:density-regulated protein DRP1